MFKSVFFTGMLLFLTGCSERPTYEEMQTHFEENRATFSMIASIACNIGGEYGADIVAISPDSSRNQTLLELADTVNIEQIEYRQTEGKCALTMPVYEDEDPALFEQFAYRYNVTDPTSYDSSIHAYDLAVRQVEQDGTDDIEFDMKLAKRWFFSFTYKEKG